MPEITAVHIGILTIAAITGLIAGWAVRGRRCAREKLAVNAGWQEQIEAQRIEHGRLVEQNKSLMEQVNQTRASGKDASNRARELSVALKEAFEKRDELQREIKDIRSNLEGVLEEREKLVSDMRARDADDDSLGEKLKAKDEKIAVLGRELQSWQDRLPPLIERFRERNEEANRLEVELAEARERICALESTLGTDETRVEPVDADALSDALDASNDPADDSDAGVANNGAESDQVRSLHEANDSVATSLRDNLKLIKGVGPAIEKTLNELGIFRFSQLAEMTEYDIDRIARRLKGFHSRIYREDWMGQARELHDRRTGSPS